MKASKRQRHLVQFDSVRSSSTGTCVLMSTVCKTAAEGVEMMGASKEALNSMEESED